MNVRLWRKNRPNRSELYGGVTRVLFVQSAYGSAILLYDRWTDEHPPLRMRSDYGRIEIDNEPGDWWT